MSPVYPLDAPMPVAVLGWDGTDFRALLVDAAHRLQIDLVDAAGIQDALQSVATDRLIVRGENQLFSLKDKLNIRVDFPSTGADPEILNTGAVPGGEWWIVTHAMIVNASGASTVCYIASITGATIYALNEVSAMTAHNAVVWNGWIVLEDDDLIRARFGGTAGGDSLSLNVHGFRMTVET